MKLGEKCPDCNWDTGEHSWFCSRHPLAADIRASGQEVAALRCRVEALHPFQQLPTAPEGYGICPTCDKGPEPGRHVRWPCPTITALRERFDV